MTILPNPNPPAKVEPPRVRLLFFARVDRPAQRAAIANPYQGDEWDASQDAA